jgi:Tfp pilus assembly protein PilV
MNPTMPPLWLDYRKAPPARQWPGLILLIASLLLAAGLLALSSHLASATALSERQVSKLQQAAERRRLFASALPEHATSSNATSSQIVAPSAKRWEALFTALEAASDETVTLLGLTPGARQIVITGEAKGLPAALDYAQRLQAASVLANAHLSKYEVVREHPRQPVLFTLLAEWRELAP